MVMSVKREFIIMPEFDKQWKAMNLTDNSLRKLEQCILDDPQVGTVVKGTGKLRKLRFAFDNKGKSGSIRVVYVDFKVYEKVYLITAYPKNEKDNLSKEECNQIKSMIVMLEQALKEARHGNK